MSSQPAVPMSSAALPAYPRASTPGNVSTSGLSLMGIVLFVISLAVVASGYTSMRPMVMGLSVHPYLLPMAIAFPLVILARITEFPIRVLVSLVVFALMYCFSVLNGDGLPLKEIFKICSGLLTIITCALLVRKRGDFVAGALGLSIAIGLLAVVALPTSTGSAPSPSSPMPVVALPTSTGAGFEVMEGANKNSYSLFALPALLMAGFIATRLKTVPVVIKAIFVVSTLPALAAIFMSANRSGYLGVALVGFMLFWDRRGRGMLVVGAVAAALIIWMANFGDTTVFDERMKQTIEGTQSDDMRIAVLWTCVRIALQNPIIGVSPDQLPFEIGHQTNVGGSFHIGYLDSHNVFGHVAAGSGLICLAALLAIGITLWTLKPADGRKYAGKNDPARQALTLMRMMLVLWVARGMFTREILYNPACNIALGLCLGLFIVSQAVRPNSDAAKEKTPPFRKPSDRPPAVPAT